MKQTLADLEELRANNAIVARALNLRRDFPDDQTMFIVLVKALTEENERLRAELIDKMRRCVCVAGF